MSHETKPVPPAQPREIPGAHERNQNAFMGIDATCIECLRTWRLLAGGWEVLPSGKIYCKQCMNAEAHG